jgi:carboxymethylenebutenolidase
MQALCYAAPATDADSGGTPVQHSISHVTYTSNGGGAVPATMVRPAAARGALPAVIVIHEAWGADAHIQDIADRIATAGYLAFVPDLYAHGGSRPAPLAPDRIDALKRFADTLPAGGLGDGAVRAQALEKLPETERERVEESMAALSAGMNAPDQFVTDLRGAVAHLRDHPDCNGQIGAIGFCLGGGLAGLLACDEPALRAAVAFYGTPPASDRVGGIACPVLGIYGGKDHRITDAVPAFADAMQAAGKRFDHHVYPRAPHAFFNDTRPAYRVRASRDAWARTLGFLVEHLA